MSDWHKTLSDLQIMATLFLVLFESLFDFYMHFKQKIVFVRFMAQGHDPPLKIKKIPTSGKAKCISKKGAEQTLGIFTLSIFYDKAFFRFNFDEKIEFKDQIHERIGERLLREE